MGCCLSKTSPISNPEPEIPKPENEPQIPPTQLETDKKEDEHMLEKEEEKEGLVIQHRKSSDKRSDSDGITSEGNASKIISMAANGSVVRTSSCTKEEVDAILIQCGRLSRSSSAISGTPKKYSGSKRSHDFDKETNTNNVSSDNGVVSAADVNEDDDERLRRRQSRGSHRRTTPSRSRERDPPSQQRSRRVSRSPGKRSESPNTGNVGVRKMVSVPASKASLSMSMEKSNNNGGSVNRVLVKRNVNEGSRAATPPRSRSPARSRSALVKNQPSPVRNSSRKSEISPYRRRTPLTDLDMNSLPFQPLKNNRRVEQDEPPTLARSRSLRKSRDFDVNVEAGSIGNYNSLLLQDIQNFHQKGSTNNIAPLKLPECVSKACSIVEAVADLNLNSSSSRSVGRGNAGDELTEPSLHKFVNVGGIDGELDEQESTGSNSLNQWVSSSSCWDEGASPASFQSLAAVSSKPRIGVAGRK